MYCQGLRMVLELEEKLGSAGVIKHCIDNPKLS
jgi:hypothetical protein